MTPKLIRRILLISLVLAALYLLAGCMSLTAHYEGGSWWEPDGPFCRKTVWQQVSADRAPGLCSANGTAATERTSCALGCVVISPYSEDEARQIDMGGMSLWAHEMKHTRGWRHP